MAKHWQFHPHDAELIERLERSAGIPSVVAQLLVGRGVFDAAVAKQFLDGKLTDLRAPELLPGCSAAAERIARAVRDKRRITIYGDYDVDGMTGTSILYLCLRLLGADVGYFIPNRLEEGYGLNGDALRTLAARGTSLVISVDCGIASVAEAQVARELGVELIITDHHQLGEQLPEAAALVHPRLPGHHYPFDGLCGAGVAFKLAWALCQNASESKKVTPAMREFLLTAISLAALGTVADVVPLVDENRLIVKHGLRRLHDAPPLGIQKLLQITKLDQKPSLSSEDIAFMIAPRLNAAGRLGQAQLGVELLVTHDPERAEALAEYIHELNENRSSLERKSMLGANKQIKERFDAENDPAFVLASHEWHPGVIGIVAGRLAEKYSRPVVMIALDKLGVKPGQGSARSGGVLRLHEALRACDEHLEAHGGHAAAAGLKIHDRHIDQFRSSFCEYVSSELAAEDFVATVRIDAEAALTQLTLRTVQQIEQLAPFGHANPRPVLCATGVTLSGKPRKMGSGERHLSLKISQHGLSLRAVAFGQAEWADELENLAGPMDIAYRPVINEFRGQRNVEVQIADWRPSQQPSVPEVC